MKTHHDSIGEFMIELRCINYPNLYYNVKRFAPFINHLLSEETNEGFYLESIYDGLLYIFKNLDMVRLMNPIYDKEKVKKYRASYDEKISPNNLLNGILTNDTFPEEGIIIDYKLMSPPEHQSEFFNLLESHFESFSMTNVVFEKSSEKHFRLIFKTFKSLEIYTHFISSLIDGMIKEYSDNSK